jgi:hypothetical protein
MAEKRIGDDIDDDRVDEIYFQTIDLLKTLNLTHDEEMVLIWNLMYKTILNYYYDNTADHVDIEKAHAELDRLVREIREAIDESNDRLFIAPK